MSDSFYMCAEFWNMRQLLLFPIIFFATSCSVPYNAYVRNFRNETAVIDVILLQKEHLQTLPNLVRVSDGIVDFKGGYKKELNNLQNVEWVNFDHFRLTMKPNSTANLTDMAGSFLNSNPIEDLIVTVTTSTGIDTLISDKSAGFKTGDFKHKGKLFGSPILYYDIK